MDINKHFSYNTQVTFYLFWIMIFSMLTGKFGLSFISLPFMLGNIGATTLLLIKVGK